MTTEPVHRLICSLAVPTIIAMLVTGLYNMVDTFFVGQIGTEATAAVGLIFPVMAIIQAFGFFFGMGSGNFISRSLGAHNHDEAQTMASTGAVCALLFGGLILVMGYVFENALLFVLGARAELVSELTVSYAREYLSIILIGAPFSCLSFVLNNQLRFQGNAMFAMVALAVGAVINCVLDPLFIFTFGLEVKGAAIATVTGQFISCSLLYIGSMKSDSLKIHFREFRPNAYYLKNIAVAGTPSLFRQSLSSVSTLCLNAAAGAAVAAELADKSIAAFSISSKIMFFAFSAVIGFGQGFQPVCGFNYGAKRYDRVKEGYLFCLRFGFVILLILSVLGFIFAEPLISLFRDDPDVVNIGKTAHRFQCVSFTLLVVLTTTNMAYQNMGKVVGATVLALARQGITFIPVILTLPRLLDNSLLGVYLAQPIADVLAFLISVPMAIKLLRELTSMEKEEYIKNQN
ncbi:MAG: MATE family efflux transporter [Oscillospiraceae bacterium]|nr:MATE family efflux transporter [Oscillospiraceae bacterium]